MEARSWALTLSGLSPSSGAMVCTSRMLRTASLGMESTPVRRSTSTEASPFMPGLSSPSSLLSEMSTGNIVTFCCTTACGSTFSTLPVNGRSGKASTVTVASWPAMICPMSVSLTRARARTRERSAILRMVEPPPTDEVPAWMTCPSDTVLSMTVPSTGARTVASSRRCCARSSDVLARTMPACALAKSRLAVSFSCAVMMRCLNRSSERFFCDDDVVIFACAASKSACAWLAALLRSRVSICTMRSPGRTYEPTSTVILVIWPDAVFDLTSTMLMGSMMAVAVASTMMSRRMTGAVWSVSGFSAFLPQAKSVATEARTNRDRRFTRCSKRGVGRCPVT